MSMDQLAAVVDKISGIVWNSILLYLLVGTGIIFTIRTRFVQVRKFGEGWRRLFGGFSLKGDKAGKEGILSGADHRDRCAGRHGQHHRLRNRAVLRRPGRDFLDVAVRVFRHVHHLRRGCARAEV